MDTIRRGFWTSLVVYLITAVVHTLSISGGYVTSPYTPDVLAFMGGITILLGLVILCRWIWSKVRTKARRSSPLGLSHVLD